MALLSKKKTVTPTVAAMTELEAKANSARALASYATGVFEDAASDIRAAAVSLENVAILAQQEIDALVEQRNDASEDADNLYEIAGRLSALVA